MNAEHLTNLQYFVDHTFATDPALSLDTYPWVFFIRFLHILRPGVIVPLLSCPVFLTPSQGQSSVLS